VNTEDKTIAARIPALQRRKRFSCISLSSPLSHKGRPHRCQRKEFRLPRVSLEFRLNPRVRQPRWTGSMRKRRSRNAALAGAVEK